MTQQKAPAGWYDDPAGSGGQRFWNGSTWTQRVEGGLGHGIPAGPVAGLRGNSDPGRITGQADLAARRRIPDGYMLLNGRQVRLGQALPQQPTTSGSTLAIGAIVAVVVLALVIVVLSGLF